MGTSTTTMTETGRLNQLASSLIANYQKNWRANEVAAEQELAEGMFGAFALRLSARMARWGVHSKDDQKDLLQEAMLRFVLQIRKEGDNSAPYSRLCTTTDRLVWDHLEKIGARKRREVSSDEGFAGDESPAGDGGQTIMETQAAIDHSDFDRHVEEALGLMAEQERQVAKLYWIEGRLAKEVAAALNINLKIVSAHARNSKVILVHHLWPEMVHLLRARDQKEPKLGQGEASADQN